MATRGRGTQLGDGVRRLAWVRGGFVVPAGAPKRAYRTRYVPRSGVRALAYMISSAAFMMPPAESVMMTPGGCRFTRSKALKPRFRTENTA